MKVEELIIDGFKSYATRTVISDWDPSFNCITGLNGSGKSNILDAICFVLGITTMSTVRAQNLQDLIYKRGQAGVTRASVTIVFDNSDSTKSPLGFEGQTHISVTRQVVIGGTSKFLINGRKETQGNVQKFFQSLQLNINNPNFLIMQGQITKVLNMKPAEILSLIEEAAGTKQYEDEREKAIKTMAKKEKKVEETMKLLNEEIEPRLDNLRNQKRLFLDYQQTLSSLERMEKLVVSHDYLKSSERLVEHELVLGDKSGLLNELNASIKKLGSEIVTLEDEIKSIRAKQDGQISKGGKFQMLEKRYKDASQEVARIKTLLDIKIATITEEREKQVRLNESIGELGARLKERAAQHVGIEREYNDIKSKHSKSTEEISKTEELLQSLQTGVSSKEGQGIGYSSQLQEVSAIVNSSKTFVGQAKVKQEHLEQLIKEDSVKTAKARKQHEEMSANLASTEKRHAALKDQLASAGFDEQESKALKLKEYALSEEVRVVTNDLDTMKRKTANIEFTYSKPTPTFKSSSVRGLVAQLFSVDKSNYQFATALEITAGGRLFDVVVDNDITATQLLQDGKLKRRVTILPLNKIIASSKISDEQLSNAKKLAPGRVELALNLIRYEASDFAAMEYVFASTLVCQDKATAQLVAFDPKVNAKCITLEGDVYDPMGTLSGGSARNSSSEGLLISFQKYNQLSRLLKEKTQELNAVRQQVANDDKLMTKFKDIKKEMDLKQHEISLYNQNLKSSPFALIISKYEERVAELNQLSDEISLQNVKYEEGMVELARIEKDMKEFKQNKGSKLEQLRVSIDNLRRQNAEHESTLKQKLEIFQTSQVELEQLTDDLSTLKEQYKSNAVEELETAINSIKGQLNKASQLESTSLDQLESEKSAITGMDDELKTMEEVLSAKRKLLTENNLQNQKLGHQVEQLQKDHRSLQNSINHLDQKHEWIENEKQHFGKPSTPYDFSKTNIQEARKQLQTLQDRITNMKRTVNAKVMNMIEGIEKKEEKLKQMINTVTKDKIKIEEAIVKVDNKIREALVNTSKEVSTNFGQIFSDLLPNCTAQLVPKNAEDITQGLEIKVALGKVWKEGLAELSGGQRSLIALSLILALLKFNPAPMYILDEVDAALDLHHTQNVGHVIKTHFEESQFIIVSLKEGMFTNANRIFRTRFQEGTSTVSVM